MPVPWRSASQIQRSRQRHLSRVRARLAAAEAAFARKKEAADTAWAAQRAKEDERRRREEAQKARIHPSPR